MADCILPARDLLRADTPPEAVTVKASSVADLLASEALKREVLATYNRWGVCMVQLEEADPETDQPKLSALFGPMTPHEKAAANGVLRIDTVKPPSSGNAQYWLPHLMHTDQAYEPRPSEVLTMLCQRPAVSGGKTTLVSGATMLEAARAAGFDLSVLFEPDCATIGRALPGGGAMRKITMAVLVPLGEPASAAHAAEAAEHSAAEEESSGSESHSDSHSDSGDSGDFAGSHSIYGSLGATSEASVGGAGRSSASVSSSVASLGDGAGELADREAEPTPAGEGARKAARATLRFRSLDSYLIGTRPDATELVAFLSQYANDPANQFTYGLRENTLMILDNTAMVHARTAFDPSGDRIMFRANFFNDEAKAAAAAAAAAGHDVDVPVGEWASKVHRGVALDF